MVRCPLVLMLVVSGCLLFAGCGQLKPLRDQHIFTSPSSKQLGISPAARAIESSLGIE